MQVHTQMIQNHLARLQAVIPQKGKQAEAGKSRIGGSRYPCDAPFRGFFMGARNGANVLLPVHARIA